MKDLYSANTLVRSMLLSLENKNDTWTANEGQKNKQNMNDGRINNSTE